MSRLNIISKGVCEGVSRGDQHLNPRSSLLLLSSMGRHLLVPGEPPENKRQQKEEFTPLFCLITGAHLIFSNPQPGIYPVSLLNLRTSD